MEREKKRYVSKYNRKEIKSIMRELKKEYKFTTGYRFLGVSGGFIFRVRSLEFYRHDEFSHNEFLSTARLKVGIEEKENGSLISVEELHSVSAIEMIIFLILGIALTAIVTSGKNVDFLSVLPTAILIIVAILALLWFVIYCANKYGDRNKGCRDKAEMFLRNRLELKEID